MRYSVYKALREVSSSILEATGYIKSNPKGIGIIADCEAGIIAIKDNLYTNNEKVIPEIDEFLEKLYNIADCVNNNEKYEDKLGELNDLAIKIDEYCKNDVKYKFRVVFFAELGAKWDAMDSVYRAYKEREDCEVLVVIQPIYRAIKLPNGEVKSDIIYEDYLTPMGIQHISFKEYDIKKDLPDLVFTSQPYESVTTEQFWAENIAPYTRLVYLPYFTAQSAVNEQAIYVQSQMNMHNMAWRVICQSEEVKALYSKYSNTKCKNFIATGLPKWDYVINMNEREINLPKEWEKLKGKKVGLINMHYNLGGEPEFYLKNIIDSMNEYKAYGGVIFRFHPLMDTMFEVYYPQFKEKWKETLKIIDESDFGVVDRNVSYDCAFKFSDFLFTSQSSMISQYLLTDKPIVIRDNTRAEIEKNAKEGIFIKETEIGIASIHEESVNMIKNAFLGNDENKERRIKAKNKSMPNLDGNIGKRISGMLIEEILYEDNIITR